MCPALQNLYNLVVQEPILKDHLPASYDKHDLDYFVLCQSYQWTL